MPKMWTTKFESSSTMSIVIFNFMMDLHLVIIKFNLDSCISLINVFIQRKGDEDMYKLISLNE
ncbi:hypothetical protein CsatB_025624 [Cannabis sativa]|uniref:Uncharacterized protein n=1 Tax=Cannabis sativa TaxID=3483 RepID=A0A803R7H3_CANSA